MADLHCQIQISIPILIWTAYQMATLYGAEYCTESVSDSHPRRGMGLESGSELFSVSLKTFNLLYLINSGNQFIHAVNFARWNGNLKFNPVHLLLNTLEKNLFNYWPQPWGWFVWRYFWAGDRARWGQTAWRTAHPKRSIPDYLVSHLVD